jgi:hypothetical protein
MIWKRYCGTAAKAGGNGENKLLPVVTGVSCLLEKSGILGYGKMVNWVIGKIHTDKEVQDVKKCKTSFKNHHSNIPSFHYSMCETETQSS